MLLLIKNATILSPTSKYHRKKKDILIQDGIIKKIDTSITAKADTIIDAKNTYVSDGWVDTFSNFCEPGLEHKEDLLSGSMAGLHGGYTDVFLIPNTTPTISSKSVVEFIKNTNFITNLHPIASVSKNCEGTMLAEMIDMHTSGAICFSDGIKPIQHSGLLLKALQYIKAIHGVLIQLPEDTSISNNGLMNEGDISTQLGLQSKPRIAETISIQRDIELAKYTQSKIHFTGITCAESIRIIKKAKQDGVQVTCSTTPFHLLYTDVALQSYNSNFKFQNPLRTEKDRKALIQAVNDGVIDCISSHHLPQDTDAKRVEFEYAQTGCISLQTTFHSLVQVGITAEKIVELLSTNTRKIFDMPTAIALEQQASITIFSMQGNTTITEKNIQSKSYNTPHLHQTMPGNVLGVVNNQQVYIHG